MSSLPGSLKPAKGHGRSKSSRHWWRALASARNRDGTRGAARPASITFTPVAVWPTSPNSGTPVMPSRGGWTAHRARSCPTSRSPSWLPTKIRIVPHSGRFRPSLAARPGVSRLAGWRLLTWWHRRQRVPSHRCMFPTMAHRSRGYGRQRILGPLPGWRRCGVRC